MGHQSKLGHLSPALLVGEVEKVRVQGGSSLHPQMLHSTVGCMSSLPSFRAQGQLLDLVLAAAMERDPEVEKQGPL